MIPGLGVDKITEMGAGTIHRQIRLTINTCYLVHDCAEQCKILICTIGTLPYDLTTSTTHQALRFMLGIISALRELRRFTFNAMVALGSSYAIEVVLKAW